MEEQNTPWREIITWASERLGTSVNLPPEERTAEALRFLTHLKALDFRDHYSLAAERLERIFADLGIDPWNTFPPSLAVLADELDVTAVDIDTLKLGLRSRQVESARRLAEHEKERRTLERILREKKLLEADVEKLKAQEPQSESLKANIDLMSRKSEDYRSRIAKLSTHIPTITYGQVQQLEDDVEKLSSRLRELQQKLGYYMELPPDMKLAKLKVAQYKIELEHALKERDTLVGRLLP